MAVNRLKRDEVLVRRTELLRLRRQGKRFEDIWQKLGYSSRSDATKDASRAMAEHREEQKAEASLYLQMADERLDDLLAAVWPKALKGDVRSSEQALKVIAAQIKLRRLDQIPTEDGNTDARNMLADMGRMLTALAGTVPVDEPEDGG